MSVLNSDGYETAFGSFFVNKSFITVLFGTCDKGS